MPSTTLSGTFEPAVEAEGLMAYVDASPSPFHAVASAVGLLAEAGFVVVDEVDPFPTRPGRYVVVRDGGSLVAWSSQGVHAAPYTPFRVVGAHTDSPNLRIKPQPDLANAGVQQLGVEVYGGPLLSSWLDRDLGLSGRVVVRPAGPAAVGMAAGTLVHVADAVLRVAELAIHLDRSANDALTLDRQRHLAPIWGLGALPGDFRGWLADTVGVERPDVLAWDVMTHDVQPCRRIGARAELLAAPRLDNQGTCYAGTRALLEAVRSLAAASGAAPYLPVLAMFDHEEVGSVSERGAASTLLPAVLERVVSSRGGSREDYLRALAGTVVASGDMAHATHPNYAERHEPQHQIMMGGGPVLKVNAQLRYATDGYGAAAFALACEQAGVPSQRFVNRTDLPCGSTVGPVTSSLLGATTVDVGAPMLSMHSSRELMAADDVWMYAAMLTAFLTPL